jgi:hypothetical protein
MLTRQPGDLTVTVGQTAVFTAAATGTPPPTYQWSLNQTNLPDATNATLTLTNVQLDQAGGYSVVVSNGVGSVTSSNAWLTVLSPVPPTCTPPPAGIVAWWPGEGDGTDSLGLNNGAVEGNLGFAPGKVGQAFQFNGANADLKIPASGTLNVGAGGGLTLEAWVNCANVNTLNPIFEWNQGDGTTYWGVHFYIGAGGPASLYANVVEASGQWHQIASAQGVVASNVFEHVALTYDQASGVARLYLNGAVAAEANLGAFTPLTTYNLYLGRRMGPDANYTFAGAIDEPSIYNRALSSGEIAAIFQADSAGKCHGAPAQVAPVIVTQPTNLTVWVGDTATLEVAASGTGPLSYQWYFSTNLLAGATNAVLTLANAQLTNGGDYSVVVSNALGSVTSTEAVLTVDTPVPASCTPPPAGIVGWWPGDGNAQDIIGGNNGTMEGSLSFGPGLVAQAFQFNGANDGVLIPANTNLDVGQGAGLTLEAWVNCSNPAVLNPIFEWNVGDGATYWGVHFYIGAWGPGSLYANVVGLGGNWHQIASAPGLITPNVFQHVALTYDQASGAATLYLNGAIVAQSNLGNFTPLTSYNLYLGRRPGPDAYLSFSGLIDEPAVYSRALQAAEIAAIYQSGSEGKCKGGPVPAAAAAITRPPAVSHFTWSPIASKQFVNSPFTVTIQAEDSSQKVFTGFNGTVTLVGTNGVPVYPPVSGKFTQGVWTGSVTIAQPVTALVLQANGVLGQAGLAAPITVAAKPSLTFVPSSGGMQLTWPVEAAGFVLETATNLAQPEWIPVTVPPSQVGNQWQQVIPAGRTNQFYRLHYP